MTNNDDKARPGGDETRSEGTERERLLAAAVADYVDLQAASESVDADAFCRRHPELEPDLRAAIQTLSSFDLIPGEEMPAENQIVQEPMPERLSGHRILGEIGAGDRDDPADGGVAGGVGHGDAAAEGVTAEGQPGRVHPEPLPHVGPPEPLDRRSDVLQSIGMAVHAFTGGEAPGVEHEDVNALPGQPRVEVHETVARFAGPAREVEKDGGAGAASGGEVTASHAVGCAAEFEWNRFHGSAPTNHSESCPCGRRSGSNAG